MNDPEAAANVLSEWADEQTKATGFPPLILVDEAERFLANFPPRFFERLRGMLERIVWIFVLCDKIDHIYNQYHHDTSPFENRLALHQLGLLEPAAAEKLIQLGRLTPEESELMHTWAGRHPFFLQLLGRSLLEGRGEPVQTILDEFQTEANIRLRRVWETLDDKEQNALKQRESISLVGDRRIGKTSVLKTWQQQIQAQNRLVIYVTGEGPEAENLSQFIKTITKQRCLDDPEDAANVLSEWAEEQTKATGFPPLILVDEAEGFIANFPPRFFERLRGMLERVVWIFASRGYLDEMYKKYHDTSPFENRFAVHQLGLLEPAAAEQLIQLGRLTPEETELMHTWAGRHPFFLQLLGKGLLDGRGEPVQVALDEFQTEADRHLKCIWDTLNDTEKIVLKQCLDGQPAELRSLRVRGLVTEEGQLFGKVLETWLIEYEYNGLRTDKRIDSRNNQALFYARTK